MNRNNERELIVGTPCVKTMPLILIAVGIILLIITITTGWSADGFAMVMYFVSPAISVVGIVLYLYAGMCSITVTDKRVYGKAGFGSRVDLPFDMISAVGITGITKGVSVSTSSGIIKFMYIGNVDEIHSIINGVLLDRQDKHKDEVISNNAPISSADELKKYKDLLDCGVITQEEFDAKKKQLLGL